jgi:hypothetical protein
VLLTVRLISISSQGYTLVSISLSQTLLPTDKEKANYEHYGEDGGGKDTALNVVFGRFCAESYK